VTLRSGFRVAGEEDTLRAAFHSTRDAVEFCLDLQRQLLAARWVQGWGGTVGQTGGCGGDETCTER
jgi:hypothetical protein